MNVNLTIPIEEKLSKRIGFRKTMCTDGHTADKTCQLKKIFISGQRVQKLRCYSKMKNTKTQNGPNSPCLLSAIINCSLSDRSSTPSVQMDASQSCDDGKAGSSLTSFDSINPAGEEDKY